MELIAKRHPPSIHVGVFGHVGNENLGDEALIAAVLQGVRSREPGSTLYGYTINPEDTQKRHHIKSFPILRQDKHKKTYVSSERRNDDRNSNVEDSARIGRKVINLIKNIPYIYPIVNSLKLVISSPSRLKNEINFLWKSYNNLRDLDLLIIAGSQQLIDYIEGPWGHPYNIFKWSFLAKMRKTRVVFLSVGAGPINSRISKYFIRYSLSNAEYTSYRDESSLRCVQNIGVKKKGFVLPDLVFSLNVNEKVPPKYYSEHKPIVGINPIPFSDPRYWPGSSPQIYKNYVNNMADFSVWLIKSGYRVLFFPTQLRLDPPVIRDIRMAMKNRIDLDSEKDILNPEIHSFDDLVEALSETTFIVATRFHGIVIPFLLKKPVIGIAYHKKTMDLMEKMEQSQYALEINNMNLESFVSRFRLLESNVNIIKDKINKRLSNDRKELNIQFDQILHGPPLEDPIESR